MNNISKVMKRRNYIIFKVEHLTDTESQFSLVYMFKDDLFVMLQGLNSLCYGDTYYFREYENN